MELAVFLISAVIALASAVMVIRVKSPVASVLYFLMSVAAQSVLFIQLSGLFVAAFLILVYAGAILVLFLFVIMMLNIRYAQLGPDAHPLLKPMGWIFGIALLAELIWVLVGRSHASAAVPETFGSVPEVARLLYGPYVYPFELTSVLLLAAIVGAVVMAKKEL